MNVGPSQSKLLKFYEKIGIEDEKIKEGMTVFWLISASCITLGIITSVVIKFIIWLF